MKRNDVILINEKTSIFTWREWLVALMLAVFSSGTAWYLIGGRKLSLNIPFVYEGDGLLISWLIKRLIDGFWYFQNDANGFPFGSDFYDYPNSDFGNLFVLKIIGMITKNYAYTMNFYFLLGFAVTATVSFFVLRSFFISRTFSVVGAVLFTFLPFHFWRLPHLFYTWYFVVPLFIWYGFKLFSNSPLFFQKNITLSSKIFHVVVLLSLSSFGVYYAFFGVLVLFIAGAIASFQQQTWKNLSAALIAILIICSGVFANVAPKIIYQMQHGPNPKAINRQAMESELYGLKITQLLLPRPEHRLSKFAKIVHRYSTTFLYINENASSALGTLGDLGFLILMAVLFVRKPEEKINQHIVILASITLFLLLCATIGGFSSLFALFVSSLIRGWNRISVFIAFTSIAALIILIDAYLKRKITPKLILPVSLTLAAIMIAFSIWDQTTPVCVKCIQKIKQEFLTDEQFMHRIESTLPSGSAIFQMPYMSFPEVEYVNGLKSYDLMKGYLHSSHLKWNYAGIKGRQGDQVFQAIARQPIARQIELMRELGFSGIYIDRRGYLDHGRLIEQELTKILGKTTMFVSNDGELVFFLLPPLNRSSKSLDLVHIMQALDFQYTSTLQQGINFKKGELPAFLQEIQGLSTDEPWGKWSDANLAPTLKFIFKKPLPKIFTLVLKVKAFGPNVGQQVKIKIGEQTNFLVPTSEMKKFRLSYHLKKDADTIEIIIPKPTAPNDINAGADFRKLGIGLEQLKISYKEK